MDLSTAITERRSSKLPGSGLLFAILLSVAYYCGAKIGFALAFGPIPAAVFWPPSAILLAGMLVTPLQGWWLILAATFPVHLATHIQDGISLEAALAWFASNCSEAMLGAICVRHVLKQNLRFDAVRHVAVFLFYCAFLAPLVSSFLDVVLDRMPSWETEEFRQLWKLRFLSHVLAVLAIVPAMLTWHTGVLSALRKMLFHRLEGGFLALALLAAGVAVFISGLRPTGYVPLLAYAPLPVLLWAAVRFDPFVVSTSFLIFAVSAPWGALRGEGAFAEETYLTNALSLQLLLIGVSIPLLLLSAAIQERRKAQESLRHQEEKLRLTLAAARMGTWDLDVATGKGSCSRGLKEIFGIQDVGLHFSLDAFFSMLHSEDREDVRQAVLRTAELGTSFEMEFRIVRQDGTVRWVVSKGVALRGHEDRPARMLGVTVDITERRLAEVMQEELEHKAAERALELFRANEMLTSEIEQRKKAVEAERMSEARFAKVFRLSQDAMSISDGMQGSILDVNDKWQALFGYGRGEAIGNTASQLNLFASETELAAVLERNGKAGSILDMEVKMRDKEGNLRDTIISGGKIGVGGESCSITIVRDITEQRRAESEAQRQREQLTHLTRVAVLGELSGALAHELNQPLAAILTNAQAALRFMNRQPVDLQEIREILDDIVDEDKRAGEVIRRLRALFMKGEPKMQLLDVNELVRDALELTHSDLIERKVSIVLQLGSGLGAVHADRVQMQQVLLNLIVNAAEAMSGEAQDKRRLTLGTDTDMDGNVRISVADTGTGIDPDVIGQVFESFFTTKAHGMGFGLSISRAIIAEHGGCIDASNNPEGGATFRITLPAHLGDLS